MENKGIKLQIIGRKKKAKMKDPKDILSVKWRANAAVDSNSRGGTVEFLKCGMTFPLQQDILDDPNVWIADSAATVQSTPHSSNLINVKEA